MTTLCGEPDRTKEEIMRQCLGAQKILHVGQIESLTMTAPRDSVKYLTKYWGAVALRRRHEDAVP